MDQNEIWNKALALLLDNVGEDDPKSVFLNLLTPVGISGEQFVLLAESSHVESWVRKNYLPEMETKIEEVAGNRLNIILVSGDSKTPQTSDQPVTPITQTTPQVPEEPQEPDWMNQFVDPSDYYQRKDQQNTAGAEEFSGRGVGYNSKKGDEALFSKCTFDTFVVGKQNELARNAALAVAEQPGTAYNPLFIYGNSGLGKTHLLVAIANYVMQNYPNMTTLYVSANKFLNDFVEATQHNQWGAFNKKYHQADVLLVDDVQYLEDKGETINQLFNIFNEMTNQNKQIVLSADRAPKDINMDDRMRSRFISGLLCDIKPPDYETRLAILKNYLSRVNQHTIFYGNISDDVLSYLAEVSTSNIREMEGAITRLISNMTLLKRDHISLEEAQELLQDFFPTNNDKQIDIALIQSEVEHFFGISHEDMISSKRSKNIAFARHIAIYLSRYHTEESLESIGKKFGGRDHTTVMHSVSKIEADQKDNRKLFDEIEQLTIRIKSNS